MQMKDFMCARHVPKKLANKITTFYTMAARRQVLEDKSLTDQLSVPLQTELMLFLYRKTLEKIPFFQVICCCRLILIGCLTSIAASSRSSSSSQSEALQRLLFPYHRFRTAACRARTLNSSQRWYLSSRWSTLLKMRLWSRKTTLEMSCTLL